ncbi:hypothetical protein HOD05_01330 [Candidatus Woesearchaeota archaeon]|jgi:DNA/RNA-binding domain of Phe-tRNA-synthetase-like protein|nr:hypothetical protein [Candidatus Woesearchaeota archaeon]MBT4151048.1 hypothetical protein [Candidatus Woesearchaeota archaeon]MBT4247575.1 hypothetical protein [Candidatus Woesearchaeota archaeon]MBT4433838.1 hypothetical protein [Candidatus Woesearchaeota archaeon]MBT7332163.1 hypothetical protein [Candidatus Woesearchaeota archaeon]
MKISIEKKVFNAYPKLRLAFILVEDIDNKANLKKTQHLLNDSVKLTKLIFHKDTIKNHDLIKPWDVAKAHFGKKARHYHTSVEKLIQNVLKGKKVTRNDTMSNILSHLSLRHIVPFGADDIHKVHNNLTFKIASGKERKGILKSLKKGDIYYQDDSQILGTKLDYWKSDKTKVKSHTAHALVHFEFLPPITKEKEQQILAEAKYLIKGSCGGKIKSFVLSKRKNSISF